MCAKFANLHTFWHTLSLDTTLTACHHAQHWTCASIDTARVQQHDASHVGMRCRASRTFQQMAKAACVSCDFGTHFGTHFGTPHRD